MDHSQLFAQLGLELRGYTGATADDAADASGGSDQKLSINVDGISMLLLGLSGAQEGQAMLCADCGEVPADREAEVLRSVLDTSMPLYRDCGATFCTNPLTGRLLLLGRVALASATAAAVMDMARQFAQGVKRFNQDHFVSNSAVLAGEGANDMQVFRG